MEGDSGEGQTKEKKKKMSKIKKPEEHNSLIEGETRKLYKLTVE